MKTHVLDELLVLEAESIHIFREVAAEMQRPCLLFSGGKDSTVMLDLARKAFAPARIPFPIMHVDTGLNFQEVLDYRDQWVEQLGLQLIVASVPDAIERGLVHEEPNGSRNRIQTPVLLEAVEANKFDALFGGGRRDEEKARAKERVFSFRDEFGQWDPKNQRPEIWNLYNGRVLPGREHPRLPAVELDRARHLDVHPPQDKVEIAPLYLAVEREVVERDGMLYEVNEFTRCRTARRPTQRRRSVRYRTSRRREPDRGRRSRTPTRVERTSWDRDRGGCGSRSAAPPAADDNGSREPPWTTASAAVRRRSMAPTRTHGVIDPTSPDEDRRLRRGRHDRGARREGERPAAVRDGGLGRRRQVDLIGRLLFDSKTLFIDQLAAVERASAGARPRLHRPLP